METITTTAAPSTLERVISSVPGKFYAYAAQFSVERPLYCLMDCKANKSRKIAANSDYLPKEVDLTFTFDADPAVCSPDVEPASSLLAQIVDSTSDLNSSTVCRTDLSEEEFFDCYMRKDQSFLVQICEKAAPKATDAHLSLGEVVAVKTASGKYGLFLVRGLTSSTLDIMACHVLV